MRTQIIMLSNNMKFDQHFISFSILSFWNFFSLPQKHMLEEKYILGIILLKLNFLSI